MFEAGKMDLDKDQTIMVKQSGQFIFKNAGHVVESQYNRKSVGYHKQTRPLLKNVMSKMTCLGVRYNNTHSEVLWSTCFKWVRAVLGAPKDILYVILKMWY